MKNPRSLLPILGLTNLGRTLLGEKGTKSLVGLRWTWARFWNVNSVDDSLLWGAMILKVDVMHMLVKTLCTCSCSMVLMMHVSMTRLPTWWVSDCEGSHRQREKVCVASCILITKIPSAPLVAITWLQHTWCPRFRRGTFGYGMTTSPTREVEYEYRAFMRM
jgi:hypothetical protein